METTIDFGNFSNQLLKDLVKSAFVKGIKFSLDNPLHHINGKLISRRNYGAECDADMNLGKYSRGNCYTFDEIQNLDFEILSKEDFEYLSSNGTWEAVSNSGDNNVGFNRRALLHCKVYGKESTFVFYQGNNGIGIEGGWDKILEENGIDPKEYSEYLFAGNWLSDKGWSGYGKALMVAIPMKFAPTPETKKGSAQVHDIKKPLFLKVDKTYKLPCHIVINLE